MISFKEYLLEQQEMKDLSHFQICELTIKKNYPDIKNYKLKRIAKEDALANNDKIVFVKHYNKYNEDISWYCCHPNGFNYYIPDNFELDGYARMTREKCIIYGVDWIICVN